MSAKLVGQRLALVFLLGLVLLNDPLLSLFDKGVQVNGIPLIYLYLMGCWAALIALVGATVAAGRADGDEPPRRGEGAK
ncbi:MAG TPA: hypothetical protein VFH22_04730 [Rhodocyclaceae bacterium]|nr:hypothetical protein [Rhodocyclaceae bacterium]